MPNPLRNQSSLAKSVFERPLKMKVQKAGFQNQEDEALLAEGGNVNVRTWYMRTGLPKFASYSTSTTLR